MIDVLQLKAGALPRAKWKFIHNESKEDGPDFYYKDVLALTIFVSVQGPKKYKIWLDSKGNPITKDVMFKGSKRMALKRGDKMLRKYLGRCIHMLRGRSKNGEHGRRAGAGPAAKRSERAPQEGV